MSGSICPNWWTFGPKPSVTAVPTVPTMADSDICWLTEQAATDPARSGGKAANLAVLVQAGLPVPDGFVVTAEAYRRFVAEHRLGALIDREIAGLDAGPEAVAAASDRLRAAFHAAPLSAQLRSALGAAYATVGEGRVAVRSSATAEDLPDASFAGQQDTVLNVEGVTALCDAVRRCWSSLWSARAIAYRRDRSDIGPEDLAIAVVVQPMVAADVAGVLFTADPVSGRRDRMVVEATAGLGDAVVSGSVTPDRWVIDTAPRRVTSGPAGGSLTCEQLDTLADLGARAAEIFGCPQDLEWALAGRRLRLLQSRPITSLFPLPPRTGPGLRVYVPVMLLAQGIAEPTTPAGTAFFRAMVSCWFTYWLSGKLPRRAVASADWLPVVAHRIFLDATPLLQRPRVAARLIANFRMKDPAGSDALRAWLQDNASRLPPAQGAAVPRGVLASIPALVTSVLASVLAPARARRRMIGRADSELADLADRAAALTDPLQRLDFVEHVLPAATCDIVVAQLAPAYAEWLLRAVIERLVRRWLDTSAGFEPVLRWLPQDPTIAMGAALAELACDPTDPGMAAFLARFGHRAPDREVDLGLPRLSDDPTYVEELVEAYRRASALSTFREGADEARRAAATLVDDVRRTRGPMRAAVLAGLLTRHHELGGLRERPKFDMVRAIALGRKTLQRCALTVVAKGLLDDPDDVFYLDGSELRGALAGAEVDLRACARTRRRTFQREMSRRLVPRVLTSEGEVVYGADSRPAVEAAGALAGTPLSPGVHEGRVRIVDSPVGAGLQKDEVLVAASTDPGWTPLFLLAGALVMEVGGVVSHGALVAREYGIPAVADIRDAMTRLHDGQRVRVDGSAGTVTVLEPMAEN